MPHEDVVPPLAISHGLRAFEWQLEPCKLGYCGSHGRASSYERGERGMHPLRIRARGMLGFRDLALVARIEDGVHVCKSIANTHLVVRATRIAAGWSALRHKPLRRKGRIPMEATALALRVQVPSIDTRAIDARNLLGNVFGDRFRVGVRSEAWPEACVRVAGSMVTACVGVLRISAATPSRRERDADLQRAHCRAHCRHRQIVSQGAGGCERLLHVAVSSIRRELLRPLRQPKQWISMEQLLHALLCARPPIQGAHDEPSIAEEESPQSRKGTLTILSVRCDHISQRNRFIERSARRATVAIISF